MRQVSRKDLIDGLAVARSSCQPSGQTGRLCATYCSIQPLAINVSIEVEVAQKLDHDGDDVFFEESLPDGLSSTFGVDGRHVAQDVRERM